MRLLHCLLTLAPLLSSCERDGAALEGEIARGVTFALVNQPVSMTA